MTRALFFSLVLATSAQAQSTGWQADSSTSPMDDERVYGLVLQSDTTGAGAIPAELVITCNTRERKPHLSVSQDQIVDATFSNSLWFAYLRTRTDSEPPADETWTTNKGLKMLFSSLGPNPGKVKALARAHRYLVEIPLYPTGRRYASFAVDGLADRLPWLARSCGWKM